MLEDKNNFRKIKQHNVHIPLTDDISSVNIWILNNNFEYTYFNNVHKESMKKIWQTDIALGTKILDYIDNPEYRKKVENNYFQLLNGESHRSLDQFTSESGEKKYFENFGSPIYDSNGRIDGIMFYTIDITRKTELEEQLKLSIALLESIMNSPDEIHILSLDRNYRYLFFNNAHSNSMQEIWDTSPEIGTIVFELLPDPDHRKRVKTFYDRALEGEVVTLTSSFENSSGETLYFENISSPIINAEGEITGLTVFIINITDRINAENKLRESLNEKEILLKEVHHRVKNNLQIISSMLNLQLSLVDDVSMREILENCINRIESIGLIHKSLYMGGDLGKIKMADYCGPLVNSLVDFYKSDILNIKIEKIFDDINLEIDQAIPVGLIINELITNCVKYASSENNNLKINLSLLKTSDDKIHLQIKDNGKGLSEDQTLNASEKLGTKLISVFSKQLNGTIEYSSANGLTVDIVF